MACFVLANPRGGPRGASDARPAGPASGGGGCRPQCGASGPSKVDHSGRAGRPAGRYSPAGRSLVRMSLPPVGSSSLALPGHLPASRRASTPVPTASPEPPGEPRQSPCPAAAATHPRPSTAGSTTSARPPGLLRSLAESSPSVLPRIPCFAPLQARNTASGRDYARDSDPSVRRRSSRGCSFRAGSSASGFSRLEIAGPPESWAPQELSIGRGVAGATPGRARRGEPREPDPRGPASRLATLAFR